jgi:MYXO-CTERM domain-containing protein
VTATGLRFFAPLGSGDNLYSVSEIQVFGQAASVPEPGVFGLAALGLALFALKRR